MRKSALFTETLLLFRLSWESAFWVQFQIIYKYLIDLGTVLNIDTVFLYTVI